MPVPPRQRKLKGEGHTRREEILDAARSLVLSEGYDRTTIRGIAQRLGVSSTTLYLYFPDRDSIMLELCDRAFATLVEAFATIAADPETPPLETLRRLMAAYVRFGLDHPDEYRLIFMVKQAVPAGGSHRSPEPGETVGARGAQAFVALQGVVGRLVAAGLFAPDDPVKLAEMLWMVGHGMVSLLITLPHFPWTEREELIRSMIELPLRGLLADDRR